MKFLHTLKPMFWTGALLALALVASTAPVLADAEAAPRASSTSIEWSLGSAERATVTVSHPDGKVTRHEFEAGRAPRFEAFDAQGQTLADGVYRYEVVGSPGLRPNLRKRVDNAPSEEAAAEIVARSPRGYVRSGTFQIRGGFISLPEPGTGLGGRLDKGAATEDQVIPDDLIVQGSGCFGFDCVNNESFGFDTIRLKENNLRIKFDDTSVGAFPANDWQLTANDSASGGSSKFSIEDITGSRVPFTITAGASTNSIFVDSTGRMGLKTSTPVLDVHINTSNTPAIRMEQNNSGGFTAQTWDIGANEANWFVRDVTGGSKLSLRIRPGAPTSSLDISSDGDVGIGTGSPDTKFHVLGSTDANFVGLIQNTTVGTAANAAWQAKADVGTTSFIAHSSARTTVRYGQAIGGFAEFLHTGGNGLMIGTLESDPIIFGTNNVNRMQIAGGGAVTVSGNFTVTGVKNFAMVDPANSEKAIYYASLEGPEAGTYYRGTSKTVDGEVVVELPGYFTRATEPEKLTVQLTALGGWSQLYVASKSSERLVIRVAPGSPDVEFDYLVQGVRLGYKDFQVERVNDLP